MRNFLISTSMGAGLALAACSGAEPSPAGSGGSAGTAMSGSAGAPAAAGMGGSAAGSVSAGAGGQPQASGAGGTAAGLAGAAGSGGGATAGAGGATGGGGGAGGAFVLTSPAFEHVDACSNDNKAPCELFPSANVMMNIGGTNVSPELNWGAGPAGTMSYVMCLHDTSNGNTHWCLWNIPAATRQLAAGLEREKMPAVPAGSSQDSFSNADDGYQGPGAKGNVYQFRLFALSTSDYMPPNAENRESVYDELEADADDVVLGTATLRGRSNPD